METSLQRQLAALAAPSSTLLIPEKKTVSILFTSKEAAGHRRDTFHAIGLDGLRELIDINPQLFEHYSTSRLFSKEALAYERIIEDQKDNDELDLEIESFLISVSPYFMLPAAMKCFEWLINRFHIQKFNITSILQCIMPYYDTKNFALVIRVLAVEQFKTNENKHWNWLVSTIKAALPLSKTILFSNSNPNFINWLFSTLTKFMKVHAHQPSNLKSFIGFATSTISGILNSILNEIPKRKEKNQRSLFRSKGVMHSLWSHMELLTSGEPNVSEVSTALQTEEIQCMIYIICSFLGLLGNQRPELNDGQEKLIGRTMLHILKNHSTTLETQVFLLLNLLTPLTRKVFKLRKSDLMPILTKATLIGESWDLCNFVSRILLNNIGFKKSGLTPTKIWSVIESIELSSSQRGHLLKNLYDKLILYNPARKWAKSFLSKFERQYPTEFELVCQSDPQFASDLAQFKTGVDLFLMVQHPDSNLRKSGVIKLLKRFKKKVQTKKETGKLGETKLTKRIGKAVIPKLKGIKPDSNATATALLPRFQDDDSNIIKILLKVKIELLNLLFSHTTLVDQLISIIHKRPSVKCTKLALKQLCLVAHNDYLPEELKSRVLVAFIPLLFPRNEGLHLDLVRVILKSKFAKNSNMLKSYAPLLDKEELSSAEVCQFSFNELKCSKLQINGEESITSKIFTLLPLIAPGDIDRIIKIAESVECVVTGIYPVVGTNFSQCLKDAEKKQILSLDLIFTTIMNLKFKIDSPLLAKVFKFVWRVSEKLENRNLCVQFLKDFVQKSFSSSGEQITFWCSMIRTLFEDDRVAEELYLLRTLQSLSVCLEENSQGLREYLVKSGIFKGDTGRMETRSKSQAQAVPVVEVQPIAQETLLEILLSKTLYHDSHRVRSWGLHCLSVILNTGEIENTTETFMKAVLSGRREIIADKEHAVIVVSKTLENPKFAVIRDRFVTLIVAEKSTSIPLLKLCQPINSQIFERFLPTVKNLLVKNPDSKMLHAVLDCYDASIDTSLEVLEEALRHKQTYTKVLAKLTTEVVQSRDVKWRKSLFEVMVNVVLHCENPLIKVAIQRSVRKWVLEASLITEMLDKCIAMEKAKSTSTGLKTLAGQKTTPSLPMKSQHHLLNGSTRQFSETSNWATRTEVVLELIQSKKRLIRTTKLIRPLFKLLKICIGLEEQSPVEYLKQLILTSLVLCCSDDKTQESNDDWIDFNVETVIDCLRCSRNPQTHHHALILLNYAAQLYPEQVLHGVMSLFTFMGNSILRQDDTYSTQLIQQTVTTVIPTFVNTNIVRKYSITRVSAGIYFAFASAVQDIPVHRRLPVFTSLVETLQPAESMWQLCVIIIDKALTRDKKRSNLTNDMELAIDIVGKFPSSVARSTLEKIYTYLAQLPIYECSAEEFHSKRLSQSANSKAVMDLSRKETLRDVEILVYYVLELVLKISASFAESEDTKLNYDTLLEKCLSYSRLVSNIHHDKIFRLITQRNLEIMDKLNSALEPDDLVRTVVSILEREDIGVKRKVLEMLNNRIVHKLEWFGNLKILLELIDSLVEFCERTPISDEVVTAIQTAFISIKLISKQIAAAYPDRFVPVFELTFQYTTHDNRLLRASAFACLGELFSLKSLILPNLSEVCHALLKSFKSCGKMKPMLENGGVEPLGNGIDEPSTMKHEAEMSISVTNLLCISTLTCLAKLCDQLGSFLGAKFLRKSLVAIFKIDGIFGQGEKATNRKKIFDQRVKIVLNSVATKIPLRNSLPSIRKVFKDIIELRGVHHTNSIVQVITTLKDTLANTSKQDFTAIFPLICESFLTDFLSYRESLSQLTMHEEMEVSFLENDLTLVENAILDCLTTGIVLKVSEGVFRTFYHKMFDWAGDNLNRMITFYRFSAAAAEKLRSLFVTFAGYVISHGTENLNTDLQLTQAILKYFYHIFSNDREGFITNDRFNALVKPLVDLIESEHTINGDIAINDININLVQLAVATNDLNRWQYLVELIALKSQHPNRKVRLFVISTLSAAAHELGKDFLPLLPPAVPFLAELLNDEDEEVEKETKRMLLKLEDIVGEPLQPYFVV